MKRHSISCWQVWRRVLVVGINALVQPLGTAGRLGETDQHIVPCHTLKENGMVAIDGSQSLRDVAVKGLEIFLVGHARYNQFRVLVNITSPGLVDELVAQHCRFIVPNAGQQRPVANKSIAQALIIVVQILHGRALRRGKVVAEEGPKRKV